MISSTFSIRVTYAETDQMKFVYYGNYAKYFEVGRVELFRDIGLSYKELEDSGVQMPVLELNVKYLRPAVYDDLLTISTKITEIPSAARIYFEYEIHNEKGTLLTTGNTSLVFVDSNTKKPVKCPKIMLEKLEGFIKKN